MSVFASKFLKVNKYRIFKGFLYVLLFVLLSLFDRVFGWNQPGELSIRLTVGMAFMGYVLRSYRKWIYIIVLQIAIAFLFNNKLSWEEDLVLTLCETLASIISARLFLFINKTGFNSVDGRNILESFVSAFFGLFSCGLLMVLFFQLFDQNSSHPFSFTTWVLSGITGIMLMFPTIISWRSFTKVDISELVHRSMLELI